MFVVIYKGKILSDKESDYEALWQTVANYFIEHRGALGSCLHKTEDGYYLAYSRWPDKKTRDAAWPIEDDAKINLPEDIQLAVTKMKSCAVAPFEEVCMTVLHDMILQ